jgi:hypothetical protein
MISMAWSERELGARLAPSDSFVSQIGGSAVAGRREKLEEIGFKLWQVEVMQGQWTRSRQKVCN